MKGGIRCKRVTFAPQREKQPIRLRHEASKKKGPRGKPHWPLLFCSVNKNPSFQLDLSDQLKEDCSSENHVASGGCNRGGTSAQLERHPLDEIFWIGCDDHDGEACRLGSGGNCSCVRRAAIPICQLHSPLVRPACKIRYAICPAVPCCLLWYHKIRSRRLARTKRVHN